MKTHLLCIMTLCLSACVEDRIVYQPISDQDDITQIMSQGGNDGVSVQGQPAAKPDAPDEPVAMTKPPAQQPQD